MNDDKNKIRTFTDLHAWQEGHKLVLLTYKETKDFPDKERFGLIDQMRRAVVSVTSNVAEGFSRRSTKEKSRFYDMAHASLVELQNQLIIARDVNYLPIEKFKTIAEQTITTSKLINGLIKATKDKKFGH